MKKLVLTVFLAICIFAGYAQSFTLRGTVVNEKNTPMEKVTVYVKETGRNEVFTDSGGTFKISLFDVTQQKTVVFSFSGYKTQEYKINSKKHDIKIVMIEHSNTSDNNIEVTSPKPAVKEPVTPPKSVVKEAVSPSKPVAKDTVTSIIKGVITEDDGSENPPPVQYAQVFLVKDGKPVDMQYTNDKGEYTLLNVVIGTYDVEVKSMTSGNKTIKRFSVKKNIVNTLNITMEKASSALEVIEVRFEPPTVKTTTKKTPARILADDHVKVAADMDFSAIEETSGIVYDERKMESKSSIQNNIKSGTLTSGEVNDFAKWHLWGGVLKNEFKQYNDSWGLYPIQRYIAQLTNKQGMPLANAEVTLKNGNGNILWRAKTDNTGKAELWVYFFKTETQTGVNNLQLVFEYERKTAKISKVIPFEQGINTAQIDVACKERNKVDVFFMIDATGSMGDEIRYLQVELDDIIQKINQQQSELQLRTGCMVYRDHGDSYLTRKSSLNKNVDKTLNFLREQSANGGGDYPEAVDVALRESVINEDWDDDALARILFVVLDAPSHTKSENIALLESQLRLAAEKGIRIVPIACSDIKKDGEYLMRTFALATNGTYLFLTDDSGVGNAHIKPSTDKYEVEKLNDAIVRVIKQYTKMPDCNNPKWAEQNKDTEPGEQFIPNPYDEEKNKEDEKLTASDIIKVYPNPCSNTLKIEVKKSDVKDIYLVDMTGKTLYGFHSPTQNITDLDVSALSTGIYFVKVFYKGKWFTEKVVKQGY